MQVQKERVGKGVDLLKVTQDIYYGINDTASFWWCVSTMKYGIFVGDDGRYEAR